MSFRLSTRPHGHPTLRLIASRAAPFALALMLAACKMPVHTDASAPPSDPFIPAATQLLDNTKWQLTEWKEANGTLRTLPGVTASTAAAPAAPATTAAAAAANPITLELSTATGQRHASGFSGCNRYAGAYALKNGLLSFGTLAGTRMACIGAGGDIEGAYLDALSRITRSGVQMHAPQALLLILDNGDRLTFTHPADAAPAAQPKQ
ncbi:META domain-containing protein [Paraburkholderia sp.]|uniref:META domain-containing protein n=1 Tax=Paraburkholderia sp. TaxID=1926495 RepID=UPI0025EB6866|nr:META domain-containing protein [Paraburkholderia sp.]